MTAIAGPKEPTNSTVEHGSKLTPREKVVLNLLIKGWNNEEIAAKMGITVRGVESHLVNIRFKTGMGRRVTLALWWFAQKLNKRMLADMVNRAKP